MAPWRGSGADQPGARPGRRAQCAGSSSDGMVHQLAAGRGRPGPRPPARRRPWIGPGRGLPTSPAGALPDLGARRAGQARPAACTPGRQSPGRGLGSGRGRRPWSRRRPTLAVLGARPTTEEMLTIVPRPRGRRRPWPRRWPAGHGRDVQLGSGRRACRGVVVERTRRAAPAPALLTSELRSGVARRAAWPPAAANVAFVGQVGVGCTSTLSRRCRRAGCAGQACPGAPRRGPPGSGRGRARARRSRVDRADAGGGAGDQGRRHLVSLLI